MDEQALKDFGLTDKEIKVYLAMLYLGPSLVQEIARKAGTYRTYTYEVLKSLKEKGIVSYVIKGNKQYYEVSPPEKLISLLDERKQRLSEVLPELQRLYTATSEKPKVEVYEGKEGLKTVLDDMIKTKKEILNYGNTQNMLKYLEHNFPQFINRRAKAKIPTRIIDNISKESIDVNKRNKDELREMHFLPKGIELKTVTNIYGNKVGILSFEDDFVGIIIENKSIAETQRTVFNLLWTITKPL